LDKYRYLFGAHRRRRWAGLILLGMLAGGIEALGAALVLVLMRAIEHPDAVRTFPGIRRISEARPDLSDNTLLAIVAALIAVFFIGRTAVLVVQTYVMNRSALNAGADLAVRLWRAYMGAPYVFHLRRNSSELIRNANDSTIQVAHFVFVSIVTLSSQALIVLGLLVVLLLATPFVTLVAGALMTLAMLLLLRSLQPRFALLGREHQASSQASLQSLQQALHGIREVTLSGRHETLESTFAQQRFRFARAQYLQITLTSLPRMLLETVLILGMVVLVLVTILVRGSLEGTVATLGLVAYALLRIIPAVNVIVTQLNSIGYGRAAVENVYGDLVSLDALANERQLAGPSQQYGFSSAIRLIDAGFTYPGTEAPALRGISLEIRKGEALGVVGRTGAGKSTLLDLVLGLIEPSSGRILIDEEPLTGDVSGWQARLGVVSQSFYIVDDTLRRNIAYGVPEAEIEDVAVTLAAHLAQLGDVLATLPDGLETRVGERGVRLSGGQRQRLAIARALYRNPEVLIFDEGTSSLDTETERELIQAVDHLRDQKTMLIVAHRIATVATCDRVALLADGELVDCAPFAEMRARYALR
jgi:ATP-binding cassette subfamily C protein